MKENRKGLAIAAIIVLFFGASVVSSMTNDVDEETNINKIETTNRDTITLNPVKDTHIRHVYPNDNYGSYDELVTRNEYGGSPGYGIDSLIEFDFSELSADVIINEASLNLYYSRNSETNPSGRPLTLHKITESWDEFEVTWSTKPSYDTDVSDAAVVPSSTNQWMSWDVKSDVRDFVYGESDNYGWEIMDETYWGGVNIPVAYFRSTDGVDHIPYLELEVIEPNSALLFGRIENLNSQGEVITFDAVNLRYIQFSPFSFNTYSSGEEIIVVSKLGILNTNFAFGIFKAAI